MGCGTLEIVVTVNLMGLQNIIINRGAHKQSNPALIQAGFCVLLGRIENPAWAASAVKASCQSERRKGVKRPQPTEVDLGGMVDTALVRPQQQHASQLSVWCSPVELATPSSERLAPSPAYMRSSRPARAVTFLFSLVSGGLSVSLFFSLASLLFAYKVPPCRDLVQRE